VKDGVLQLQYGERQTRTYTIRNVDPKPKILMLQQEGRNEYFVLSPNPTERTATAYRFEVKMPPNGSQLFKVEEERIYANSTAVLSATPDFLLTLVENKELTEHGRKQMQAVLDSKLRLAEDENNLQLATAQTGELSEDQSRLRADIDSLNRVKGQEDEVRKYSGELAGNEGQLDKLREQRRDLELRKANLEAEVKQEIEALDF